MTELPLKLTHKELQSSSKSKHQEMRDYLEIIKIERRKYIEKKTILHMVSLCLHESDLDEELKNNVRSILLSVEVNACMDLKTTHSDDKLLGLSSLGNIELSFNEQEQLNHAVHSKLNFLHKNIANCTSEQEEILSSPDLCLLTIEDKQLLDERKRLNELQESYMRNLKNMYELLQDLLQSRFENAKKLAGNKMDEYSLKSRMYHLRTQMVKEKTKIDFFNETPISLQAYKELFNNISEQQNNYRHEIKDLVHLSEKYKLVVCKEYHEILKSFLQYQTSIEKKKDLYKQLKEK